MRLPPSLRIQPFPLRSRARNQRAGRSQRHPRVAVGPREQAGLSTHHGLMFVAQRMHTFFGPDQSWKAGNPLLSQQGVVQEFQFMGNIGMPQQSTQEHLTAHAQMLANTQTMLTLLAAEVTL